MLQHLKDKGVNDSKTAAEKWLLEYAWKRFLETGSESEEKYWAGRIRVYAASLELPGYSAEKDLNPIDELSWSVQNLERIFRYMMRTGEYRSYDAMTYEALWAINSRLMAGQRQPI